MQPESDLPDRLITTYLEMTSPDQLRAEYVSESGIEIRQVRYTDLASYRELYASVGEQWLWRDRLLMPDDELADVLAKADISVLYVDGQTAGYIELAADAGGSIEIAYFGLLPQFIGRGLGKHLLSNGVQRAWDNGAGRVWLHTCNLDGPAALSNYLARGFVVTHVDDEPMPDEYR